MHTSPLLELKALSKSYSEGGRARTVLDGIDVSVAEGEFLVLLGRSGSGKSTLLNLISGIDLPSAGEVHMAGTCLTALDEGRRTLFRRHHMGFVFQAFNLIPTLTVEENLLLPLELIGVALADAAPRVRNMLRDLGLDGRGESFPDQLSGGEQQRVAIGRALIHDPRLLLADEPTGNLDLETGREVLALLDRLTRQAGKTLIMVTHAPEVVGLADRVMSLRQGRLVEVESGGP